MHLITLAHPLPRTRQRRTIATRIVLPFPPLKPAWAGYGSGTFFPMPSKAAAAIALGNLAVSALPRQIPTLHGAYGLIAPMLPPIISGLYRFNSLLPYRPVGLIRRISSMMANGAICASGA